MFSEPEVTIINRIAPEVLVQNPSFNGTVWNTVLRYGEATSPRPCMRGEGSVHFKKLDTYSYCRNQSRYSLIDSICMCDSTWVSPDTDIIDQTPIWFNYKTISATDADRGFFLIELTEDNMEQDFSVPGPYGH
ncbi:MAG: hypothetical protein GX089_09230 [Fibrobacter sp.]|nr:hypothetical protein [Fibrobacter sp.]